MGYRMDRLASRKRLSGSRSKKRLFFIAIVVAAVLLAGGAALAWWTVQASIDENVINAGSLAFSTGAKDGKIVLEHMVPATGPTSPEARTTYFYLKNTGNVDLMFYGYLDPTGGTTGFANYIHVKVTLGPAPWSAGYPAGWDSPTWHDLDWSARPDGWAVYEGPLADILGSVAGKAKLSSRHGTGSSNWDIFHPGDLAVYKAVFWLDQNTPDSFQGANFLCNLRFWGTQVEGWVD